MLDTLKKTTMSCRKAVIRHLPIIHSFHKSGSSRLETCRDDSSLLRSTVRGFTLIELLVVVLIIGILASVALPQYQKAVVKARMMTVISTLRAIKNAQELYYMEHDTYATDFADLDIELPAGGIKEQTASDTEYTDGSRFKLQPNSVYGYPKGLEQEVALEWYYDHQPTYASMSGVLSCNEMKKNTRFAICKAMGGTLRYDYAAVGQKFYNLNL